MHIESRRVFKQAAMIAKGIGFFPAVMIGVYLLNRQYQQANMPCEILLALGIGTLGYLQMQHKEWLETRLKAGKFLGKLFMGVGYAVTLIILIFCVSRMAEPIYQKVFLFIYCLGLYLSYIADYIKPYHQVLSIENLVFITAVYILAVIFTKNNRLGILYIMIVGVYLLISNQSRLERMLQVTRENTPMVQQIRRDNMRWVCLLMSIILIVYPLRGQLAGWLQWLLMFLLTMVLKLFGIIITVMNFLLGEGQSQSTEIAVTAGKIEAAERNAVADDILILIAAVLGVVCVIKNRKKIFNHFKGLLQQLAAIMKKLYHFLFGKRKTADNKQAYYMDTVESIDQCAGFSKAIQKKMSRRQWRRQVKKYLKQLSPQSSYRKGYQLILQGVRIKGIEIRCSDTPREMLKQIEGRLTLINLPQGTKIYEEVRYGEKDTAMSDLEKAADLLRQLLEIS